MSHGAKIAMLGIPSEDMTIDWRTVIFNMLTIKGIYGREMYETWYKMSVMLQSGLDISPVITHRSLIRSMRRASRRWCRGIREGDFELGVSAAAKCGGCPKRTGQEACPTRLPSSLRPGRWR